jgi:WD40 repeat protein
MPNKPFNAFLSYSRKDGVEFVNRLREKLAKDEKGKEIKLWKDREQMEGDIGWWQQITTAIDQSEYLILVITPESLKSGVCQKEWRYSRQVGVCVCPVKGVPDIKIEYDLLPISMKKAHIYDINEEWAKFVNDLCRSCQVKKVPFMAPDMPKDYVLRFDLINSIKQQLLKRNGNNNIALSSALRGAGGFGKTTLATSICYDEDIQEFFSSGILWVTLGEEDNTLKEITKVYNAISIENRNFIDVEEASRMLSEKLDQGDYLLIIDDVWKYHQLEPFLRKAFGTVRLITTRIDEVVREAKAAICQVNEMEKEEAFQMLAKDWELDQVDKIMVEQLIKNVGEWPLILKLMRSAALSRIERGQSIKDTIKFLGENYGRKGLIAFDVRDPKSRNDAVAYCIEASLKMFNTEQRWKCIELGIFPTDTSIPIDVVYNLWNTDSFDGESLLMEFDEYSLLDFNMGKGEVTFHDVMLHYYNVALGIQVISKHNHLIHSWKGHYLLPNIYAWQFYIWHLIQAENHKEAEHLLSDYKWLKRKFEKTDIHAILLDYSLITQKSKQLELIYRAFRMSAHILAIDKTTLALQLHERLRFGIKELPPGFYKEIESDLDEVDFKPISTQMLIVGNLIYTLNQKLEVYCCIKWKDNIIIGLSYGIIKIINIKTGRTENVFKGHSFDITCLAITENILVSGSSDYTVRSWDLTSGKELYIFKGHSDRISCLAIIYNTLVSGSWDNTLRSWDLSTGKELNVFKGHSYSVSCLAIANNTVVSGSNDSTLRSWNLLTGNELNVFKGHSSYIDCVAIVGNTVVSGSGDNTLRSWDLASGKELNVFEGHTKYISCLTVTGNIVVSGSGDNTLRSWDLASGKELNVFKGHSNSIKCICISEDKVASGDWTNNLRSWDLTSGKELNVFKGHDECVNCLAITENILISGSRDNTLRTWYLTDTNEQKIFSNHTNCICSLKIIDNTVLSGSYDTTLKRWDLLTGKELNVFKGHTGDVYCLAIINNTLVSGSRDRTLRSWDLASGKELNIFKGHSSDINCLAIAGNTLLSGSHDNTLRSWDLESGKELNIFKGHTGSITCLSITGNMIVSGSSDHTLRSWNFLTGKELNIFTGHSNEVSCLGVAGNTIISGSWDYTLRSWDVASGKKLNVFKGHSFFINCLAIVGNTLVSGSCDNTIRKWDLTNGQEMNVFEGHSQVVNCLSIIGNTLVSGSDDKTIRIWDLKKGIGIACLFLDESVTSFEIDTLHNILIVGGNAGGINFFNIKKGLIRLS